VHSPCRESSVCSPSQHSKRTGMGWGWLTLPGGLQQVGSRGSEKEMPVQGGCHSNGVREDSSCCTVVDEGSQASSETPRPWAADEGGRDPSQ